jgi:hypothetical protein
MATEPKPDLPNAVECVQRAWHALHVTDEHPGYPLSTLQAFYAESQAWSLLALAQGRSSPAIVQSVPQPPTPAPVARRKPGPKPKPKPSASAGEVAERLRAKWDAEDPSA